MPSVKPALPRRLLLAGRRHPLAVCAGALLLAAVLAAAPAPAGPSSSSAVNGHIDVVVPDAVLDAVPGVDSRAPAPPGIVDPPVRREKIPELE